MVAAVVERVLGVVEEHQVRLPPEISGGLLHGPVQPYRVQGVLRTLRPREVAHLRGDREPRQKVADRPRQDCVRAEAEVVGTRVDRGDAEIQRAGQEATFVTRPV